MALAQRVIGFPVEVYQAAPESAATTSPGPATVFSAVRPHHRIMVVDPARLWYGTIVDRLNMLCALDRGWDGYGAGPVSFDTANFALRMLEWVCASDVPAPSIVPGPNGDLQLEWHIDGMDLELHVRAPNDVRAWRETATTGMDGEEIRLTNDFTLVAEWVRDLVELLRASKAAAA